MKRPYNKLLNTRSMVPQRQHPAPVIMLGLMLATMLHACTMAPHVTAPDAPDQLPDTFNEQPADSLRPQSDWWLSYGDPVLNRIVDSVQVRNLDLAVAAARVAEVQRLYRISRAGLFPSVQASVDGTNSSTPSNVGFAGDLGNDIPGFPERFENVQYSASLGLSYELDFWGRVRGAKEAALRDYFAAEADYQTAQIGVLAETVATYYEILELERQRSLSAENVELLAERAGQTSDRYQRGLVTSFERYTIQQEYDDTRANLPLLDAALVEARGRLAILLGTVPAEADRLLQDTRAQVVNLDPIPAGLPSDLLRARPDVWAAEQRMESARQRIGVARADRFPRFALTASGGTQSSTLSDLVNVADQNFRIFGGSLTAPVFNAGALRAAEQAAWARYEQAAASYEKAVLTAFKETESALVLYAKERERYAFQQEALTSAQASAQLQEDRYVSGVGDYLAFLDARRNLIRAQLAVASSERALANARLAVHRALGGGWHGAWGMGQGANENAPNRHP